LATNKLVFDVVETSNKWFVGALIPATELGLDNQTKVTGEKYAVFVGKM
jgi:hypothetical protein